MIETYQIGDIAIRLARKDEGYAHTAINVVSNLQRTEKEKRLKPEVVKKKIAHSIDILSPYVRHIPNVYFASVPNFKSQFPIHDGPERQLTGFANSSVEKDSLVLDFIATVRSIYPTGKALMGLMIAQAKEINAVDVQTETSSEEAFEWFQGLDFRLISNKGAMRLPRSDFDNTLEKMSRRTGLPFI